MKIRRGLMDDGSGKVRAPMAAMIDVVFLLLLFFMLTLKIIQPEGHFDIRMPIGADPVDLPFHQPLLVRLTAEQDGSLQQVYFGQRRLGNDSPECFERLNIAVARLVGGSGVFADDIVVEIDAAYNLEYEYTIKAVSSCLGRIDPETQERVPYVSNITFKPPRRPGA